jgi:hypothetical protein
MTTKGQKRSTSRQPVQGELNGIPGTTRRNRQFNGFEHVTESRIILTDLILRENAEGE